VYFTAGSFPYCGISAFTFSSTQAILLNNACIATSGAYGNHSTFSHEIGHYFNLFHTHEPAFGLEFVNGSNCGGTGDLVCDTPADPSLNGVVDINCQYTGNATDPNGATYSPDPHQLMSYSTKYCRDTFSPQSIARIVETLFSGRESLLTNPVAAPTADLAARSGVTLSSPRPNPTTGFAELRFSIPYAAVVDVTIYDVRGARVRTIANRLYLPGDHVVGWDGADAAGVTPAAGVYFARLSSSGVARTQKILRR
jgi:hypothetical protein